MPTIDPSALAAFAAVVVTIIGALAAAVVTIMRGFSDMRVHIASVESTATQIHTVVNGGATALKEQNERQAMEASRIAKEIADAAYLRGMAEGQLHALRETGVIPARPVAVTPRPAATLPLP